MAKLDNQEQIRANLESTDSDFYGPNTLSKAVPPTKQIIPILAGIRQLSTSKHAPAIEPSIKNNILRTPLIDIAEESVYPLLWVFPICLRYRSDKPAAYSTKSLLFHNSHLLFFISNRYFNLLKYRFHFVRRGEGRCHC